MDDTLIADVRAFSRFFTRQIGLLEEHFNHSRFTLPEGRVLYEIATRGHTTLAEIARSLAMDGGYASRLLHKLVAEDLAALSPSATDRRSNSIALTRDGDAALAQLDAASNASVAELLKPLNETQRQSLVAAMRNIRILLGEEMPPAPVIFRAHRMGELGWITHRQAVLYNRQFGWGPQVEGIFAGIYAQFMAAAETPPKSLWIAERAGKILGSIFIIPAEGRESTAQLRMLYVEPEVRRLGIGSGLVAQAIAFSRSSGYRRIRLLTESVLISAHRIYAAAGFKKVEFHKDDRYGPDLQAEYWELDL